MNCDELRSFSKINSAAVGGRKTAVSRSVSCSSTAPAPQGGGLGWIQHLHRQHGARFLVRGWAAAALMLDMPRIEDIEDAGAVAEICTNLWQL